MRSNNKLVEHRKHQRFQAPKGVFVGVGPDFVKVGPLRDLSLDGLAFRYVGDEIVLNGSYVDMFMTEGDFYLGKLLIEIVSDIEVVKKTPSDSKTLRRCCVKFKKLTPEQKAKLQEFIDNCSAGEA
jgi:c-di-GMP-binding flagellar brake protein YcgR